MGMTIQNGFWKKPVFAAGALAAAMLLSGCESMMMQKEAPAPSLYQRLGEKPAITAVVDQFVANVAADARINQFFAHTDIANLKTMLVDQICEATGGPCVYTGGDMKSVHEGMGVTDADFNALVEDLVAALDQFNVPEQEKSELLGALGGMKGDIVDS
ncbi:MAG: group 1 truncated hemoglobin [Paracoccaceae bacterium]